MVDYSLPVAKRTRLGVALASKEKEKEKEKIWRKKNNGSKRSSRLKLVEYAKRASGSKRRSLVGDAIDCDSDCELLFSPGKQIYGYKKVEEKTPIGFNGVEDEEDGLVFLFETKRVLDSDSSDDESEKRKGCGLDSDTRPDHGTEKSNGCGLDSDKRSDQESEDVVVVSDDGEEEDASDSQQGSHRTEDGDFVLETEQPSPVLSADTSSSSDEEVKEGRGGLNGSDGAEKKANLDENVEEGARVGVKRKLGLNFFVKEKNDGAEKEATSIFQRTRSKSKINELKSGTLCNPISLEEEKEVEEEEEMEDSYRSPENDDNGDVGGGDIATGRRNQSKEDCSDESENVKLNNDAEEDSKERKRRGRPPLEEASVKKRRGRPPLEKMSLFERLEKSLWDEDESFSLEKWIPCPRRVPDPETPLPSKFTFGIEEVDSVPSVKSEYDKHLDDLWSEFDICRSSLGIGSTPVVENDDAVCPDVGLGTATCCRRGDHQFVLDEEIGVLCKICSFVKEEIKHIVPDFGTKSCEKRDWRGYDNMPQCNFDELQYEDSVVDSCSGLDPIDHAKETVWDLVPGIKNSLYPHQRKGIEFIWKNIAGGIRLDDLPPKSDRAVSGNGCIISHAPGTGKTRLTIVFLQTYMKLNKTCRPVIIAPCSMLLTWEEELRKWNFDVPFHNLNNPELSESGKENELANRLLRYRSQLNVNAIRLVKLYCWKKFSSILGISYSLLGSLCKPEGRKSVTGTKAESEANSISKILREIPDLIVFDEGHTPRNDNTKIWQAASMMQTEKRIVLSGTPFQNNFDELLNTICLARRNFRRSLVSKNLGELKKKPGLENKEAKKKWNSLTCSIGKNFDDKAQKEIQAMISPFVHVHRGSILNKSLPGLRNSVIILQPGHLQRTLLDLIKDARRTFQVISWENLICWGSIHPSLLAQDSLYNRKEFSAYKGQLEELRLHYEAGVKTKFLWEIIRLSMALKEKVLVFSQFLGPLELIMDQLKYHFGWAEGKEVLKMDGKTDVKNRQTSIKSLNDPHSEAQVLLASTKACCEGINLIGASRVVLLDVVWNPSVEKQAISRAYRIGQKRVVHVYHLLTRGTMEFDKYRRQTEKDKIFELVFSPSTSDTNSAQKISSKVSNDRILEELTQNESFKHVFEVYSSKDSNLTEKDHDMEL